MKVIRWLGESIQYGRLNVSGPVNGFPSASLQPLLRVQPSLDSINFSAFPQSIKSAHRMLKRLPPLLALTLLLFMG